MLKTAIILAAGLGTRMRPLTNDRPKPMIEVLDKPLIGYVIEMCLQAGVTEIIINFHYKPEPLKAYINAHYADIVTLSNEENLLLDSGGGTLKALQHTDASEFFVINADCIWHSKHNALTELYNDYQAEKYDVFKLLACPHHAIGFDSNPIYSLDEKGFISKGLPLTSNFTGIQILKRSLFDHYTIEPFSIRSIWNHAFENNRVGGIEYTGTWLHIGTPQAVIESAAYLKTI